MGPLPVKPLRGGISKPGVAHDFLREHLSEGRGATRKVVSRHGSGGRLEAASVSGSRHECGAHSGGCLAARGRHGRQRGVSTRRVLLLAGGRLGFEGDILQNLSLARSAVDGRLTPACPTAARPRPRSSTGPGKGQGRRRNARSDLVTCVSVRVAANLTNANHGACSRARWCSPGCGRVAARARNGLPPVVVSFFSGCRSVTQESPLAVRSPLRRSVF